MLFNAYIYSYRVDQSYKSYSFHNIHTVYTLWLSNVHYVGYNSKMAACEYHTYDLGICKYLAQPVELHSEVQRDFGCDLFFRLQYIIKFQLKMGTWLIDWQDSISLLTVTPEELCSALLGAPEFASF